MYLGDVITTTKKKKINEINKKQKKKILTKCNRNYYRPSS